MRLPALFFAGFLTLLGGAALAYGQTAPDITVRAGNHPGFDRIVFDWPRAVSYRLSTADHKVTIRFDAAGQARFNKDMFGYLTRATGFSSATDPDGHLTVSFAIGPRATVKDFTSDHSVVLDIQGDMAPHQALFNASAPAPAASPAATPAIPLAGTGPQAQATEAPLSLAPQITPTPAMPASAPAAPATASPPVAKTSDKTADKTTEPPAAKPPEKTGEKIIARIDGKTPPAAATTVQTAVLLPTAAPASSAAPRPSTTPPSSGAAIPPAAATTVANPAARLTITDTPVLVATLDPHTPLGAAIYKRAGYVYIVFERKLTLDLAALTAGQAAAQVTLEPLDLPKNSGFRFAIGPDISLRASRENTAWKIYLAKQQPDIPVSNNLIAQPDFALGARYILPLASAPEPVYMSDPVVGDDLILIPLQQTEAFSVARAMADFKILPAAQGLVIRPCIDKLIVRAVSDGLELTAEGGLHLSSAIDTGASLESAQKLRAAATGKSMFAFNSWQGHPNETFTRTRQRLQQTVVDVPEPERNRARLELARFYFAHGYGEETVGLLQELARQIPDLMAHPDFVAMLGAAEILAYHADQGLRYLDMPALAGQPEITLWRAVAHAELRDWQNAAAEFESIANLLDGYPEPFYSRFSVLAIESALAIDNDRMGATLLDKLEAGPHSETANPAMLYLRGILYARAAKAGAAQQAWKDVAASHDRLYKVRAELALIDLGVSTKSLTPAQAADRLEALRFGWRGDDLEIDILKRLGEFYIQAHNIRAGINVLGQAAQLYPDSPMTPAIRSEMQKIFHDIFLGSANKDLSPLDALTLYQQFRDLMPTGKEGDIVTRNLAERLVDIDLLDQSASLLQDLVKTRLQGEEKARTATRLAAIRLLDHKPADALAALSYDEGETLPADLQGERVLLRARALSELHKDDEALALLKDNAKPAAKLLRADITIHAEHWADAAKALMDLIGPPPNAGEPLSNEQAQWLVRCAVAYALAGDQVGVDKLAIDYGAAMAGTPENDTFRVLTEPDKNAQSQDIAAARAKIDEVDLFQSFLNGYRKGAPPDAASAAATAPVAPETAASAAPTAAKP